MKRRKMNDSENIKMNLNIGGQRIVQTVPFRNQDFVRDVEKEEDNLYSKWRKEFHSKTDREILAMVAYRFASFYCELKDQYAKAAALADECILAAEPDHGS